MSVIIVEFFAPAVSQVNDACSDQNGGEHQNQNAGFQGVDRARPRGSRALIAHHTTLRVQSRGTEDCGRTSTREF